jgi:hypothetical protein
MLRNHEEPRTALCPHELPEVSRHGPGSRPETPGRWPPQTDVPRQTRPTPAGRSPEAQLVALRTMTPRFGG